MKMKYQKIYTRTREMLIRPAGAWQTAISERTDMQKLLYAYFLPLSIFCSLIVLLINLFTGSLLQALGTAVINLASSLVGSWIAYLLIREYLCKKLNGDSHQALSLTAYSAAIFILFHSLGVAFGNLFISQLFILASFIFIRTLYAGINLLDNISSTQKTNLLIISSLSIVCFPIIVTQLLNILFRISAINL